MTDEEAPTTRRASASRERPGIAAGLTASHIRLWAIVLVVTVIVSTVGYVVLGDWSISDALYMTGITLTTVGFREVRELSAVTRIWTVLVSVAGVAIIFGSVGIITEYLVSEVTSGRRESRRMDEELQGLRDHYVLCGYGRVGSTVAELLVAARARLVVVDIREDSLTRARRDGLVTVEGDATEEATLRSAGIERARGLITTVDSDASNVYVILTARGVNPNLFVVGRANAETAEAKLRQAGADRVVSPYTMAGRRIAELAVRPRVVDFIDAALSHGELAFGMEDIEVAEGGRLVGRRIGELRERGVFALAIIGHDGEYEPNPLPDRALAARESLIVSGSADALRELRAEA